MWWIPVWWTTHYSLLKTCKIYRLEVYVAVCTRQCSGWDWTRDLQSQVQRPNHYMYLAAPCGLWNTLPLNVTSASSISVFRKHLKTHLFSHSFPESPVVPVQWLCHFGHYNRSCSYYYLALLHSCIIYCYSICYCLPYHSGVAGGTKAILWELLLLCSPFCTVASTSSLGTMCCSNSSLLW